MKKRFFSTLLMGALAIASVSTFTSCKDYDDDINDLQAQIDANAQAIKKINDLIASGSVITSVDPITTGNGGIKITLSNGASYDITNGADGAAGADGKGADEVWDIRKGEKNADGQEYFWYKNGENTGIPAQGPKGADGGNGTNGTDGTNTTTVITTAGKYYAPNPDTGTFWIYNDGDKAAYDSGISFLGTGAITATKDNDDLILYGVKNTSGPVTISLSGKLTALVWKNTLSIAKTAVTYHWTGFLDGIETIEYPWLQDTILKKSNPYGNYTQPLHHKKTVDLVDNELHDYLPNTLLGDTYNTPERAKRPNGTPTAWQYSPVWPVEYHLNPASANPTYAAGQPHFFVLESDVDYTRASASTLNISSPETYGWYSRSTEKVYGVNEGIVTVGLKIAKPWYLEPNPTIARHNAQGVNAQATTVWGGNSPYVNETGHITDNTIALQLKNDDSADITSDYTLLQPSLATLEGLVWVKEPMYCEPGQIDPAWTFQGGPNTDQNNKVRIGDEKGWYDAQYIHVYDSPEEALDNQDGAALELMYQNSTINLKDYLGIHLVREDIHAVNTGSVATSYIQTLKASTKDEEQWGLHYEFQLVDYQTSGNDTRDSRYVSFYGNEDIEAAKNKTIDYNGVLIVRNVMPDGEGGKTTIETASRAAIGREPLVRVMVKNDGDDVLLDGYILLHIDETPQNLSLNYPTKPYNFNFCDDVTYSTDWAEFNYYILTVAMNGYRKATFDRDYWADCYDDQVAMLQDYRSNFTLGAIAAADQGLVSSDAASIGSSIDGNKIYSMKIFNFGDDIYGTNGDANVPDRGNGNGYMEIAANNWVKNAGVEDAPLGVVKYYPNHNNTQNHIFTWTISAAEVEYLTHDKANDDPITVSRWVRFQAKNYDANLNNVTVDEEVAPYPYIWVKLTMTITRNDNKTTYTEKNTNYWYNYSTGAADGWSGILFDIMAPRDNQSIKNQLWNSEISEVLVENYMKTPDGVSKYYFAPREYTITTLEGNTYTITPHGPANHHQSAQWNKLYCKYVDGAATLPTDPIKKAADYHIWQETEDGAATGATVTEAGLSGTLTLEAQMKRCAIDFNKGVFENDTLFAFRNGVYTPIARIETPIHDKSDAVNRVKAGQIQLLHHLAEGFGAGTGTDNPVCYEVLNAIGYAANNANIQKQLRAWLGVVNDNGCGVAKYVEQAKRDDDKVTTFLASWERPINLKDTDPDYALDANTNENFFYLIDYLKLYDWRGDYSNQGYMYEGPAAGYDDDHFWFWAYYNIKQIDVDMNPNSVYTNMHQASTSDFVPLAQVTTQAILVNTGNTAMYQVGTATLGQYPFDLVTPGYNRQDREAALQQYMQQNKYLFGGWYYANNGDNVTEFDVKIPIWIHYEWGKFKTVVTWHIDTTHGH